MLTQDENLTRAILAAINTLVLSRCRAFRILVVLEKGVS